MNTFSFLGKLLIWLTWLEIGGLLNRAMTHSESVTLQFCCSIKYRVDNVPSVLALSVANGYRTAAFCPWWPSLMERVWHQ